MTVRTKIVAGLATILGVGALSMLIIYQGLDALREGIHDLTEIQAPGSAAAYEMEINANGIALGVMKYLESADSEYRRLVEDDQSDFERFHAEYLRLSESQEQKALGDTIGARYREFRNLANLLMDKKDEQETMFASFGEDFERLDVIIDEQIQPRVDRERPDGYEKVEILNDVEADIAEVAFWLANYERAPRPEYRDLIFANYDELLGKLAAFQTLDLTRAERRGAGELEDILTRMLASTRIVLADDDFMRERTRSLVALRTEIDRILDERIQILARQALYEPRREAEAEAEVVLDTIRFLIPIFILSAVVVAFLLIKGVTGPLRKLKQGTEAVRGGDLSYRIDFTGQDEFAVLAAQFDDMVARLEATKVSKELLEASEETLRQTVQELRREIDERLEAEEEQARLQASLRRSERMSAMGALIAGVAHEVRNPLFGVSSTLDAMDARLGGRQEYQRYMVVLRSELKRLNDLMRELLEYGKPPAQELLPSSIESIVTEAVTACEPLAQQRHVAITNRVPSSLALVPTERSRMIQVFCNLIENALQHTPPGGTVTVEASECDGNGGRWIECAVRDTGPGFEPECLTEVFEPFFSRRRGGTGLGLSIVHRIVDEHGGLISAANASSGGAVVMLRLPI